MKLSKIQVGVPKTSHFTGSTVSVIPEDKRSVINLTCFTGQVRRQIIATYLQPAAEGELQRQNPSEGVAKIPSFTQVSKLKFVRSRRQIIATYGLKS